MRGSAGEQFGRPGSLAPMSGATFGPASLIAALAKQPVHGFDSFQGLPEDWHAEPRGSYSTGSS